MVSPRGGMTGVLNVVMASPSCDLVMTLSCEGQFWESSGHLTPNWGGGGGGGGGGGERNIKKEKIAVRRFHCKQVKRPWLSGQRPRLTHGRSQVRFPLQSSFFVT